MTDDLMLEAERILAEARLIVAESSSVRKQLRDSVEVSRRLRALAKRKRASQEEEGPPVSTPAALQD